MVTGQPKDWVANESQVLGIANFMVDKLNEYLKEHPTNLKDVFMGVHMFHKRIVVDIAAKMVAEGIEANRTYRMADTTWRKAMRELKL